MLRAQRVCSGEKQEGEAPVSRPMPGEIDFSFRSLFFPRRPPFLPRDHRVPSCLTAGSLSILTNGREARRRRFSFSIEATTCVCECCVMF